MGGLWRGGLACVKTYKVLERVKQRAGWWEKKKVSRDCGFPGPLLA